MAVVKQVAGTKTALTVTGLATLAAATYVTSATYNCTTNQPLDVVVEVDVATTNAVAGNKQLVVFIKESFDNSIFRSGPGSGTTATDEPNLRLLGVVPLGTSSTTEVGFFSITQALGYVPAYFQIVLKNDVGVALTSAAVSTVEISGTVL